MPTEDGELRDEPFLDLRGWTTSKSKKLPAMLVWALVTRDCRETSRCTSLTCHATVEE